MSVTPKSRISLAINGMAGGEARLNATPALACPPKPDCPIPKAPFGAGTLLEGHVAALKGGLCIDISRMTRIIAVHAEDLDLTLEAGVTRQQLNEHLRDTGIFFPVDPGGESTIGGMAATRASVRSVTGPCGRSSSRSSRSYGQVVRTASRARKSSAGYDLTRLLVGPEGTLGIISFFYIKEPELMVRRV